MVLTSYFQNSSAEQYRTAEHGLIQLGATNSLKLLRQAKEQLFGANPVPKNQTERWDLIDQLKGQADLDSLDDEFYKDEDELYSKLERFAI